MKTWWESDNLDTTVRLYCGDVREVLAALPEESVHTVVTSPPYWGLRDYGIEPQVWGGDGSCGHVWGEDIAGRPFTGGDGVTSTLAGTVQAQVKGEDQRHDGGQSVFCTKCGAWRGSLGLEPDPVLYVAHMVEVFRAVRRVLRRDGTCWLNMGDCYATGAGKVGERPGGGAQGDNWQGPATQPNRMVGHRGRQTAQDIHGHRGRRQVGDTKNPHANLPEWGPNRAPVDVWGLKPKDLVGIPWRVAFALQEDGWWLRSDIVWAKPNPMPESITDRPTKAHEYLFLLTRAERYFYDADAIRETGSGLAWNSARSTLAAHGVKNVELNQTGQRTTAGADTFHPDAEQYGRNKRTVWTIPEETRDLLNKAAAKSVRSPDAAYWANIRRQAHGLTLGGRVPHDGTTASLFDDGATGSAGAPGSAGGTDAFVWRNREKYSAGEAGSFTRMARYVQPKQPSGWNMGDGSHDHIPTGKFLAKTAVDPHLGGRRQAPEPGEPNAFHPLGRNRRTVWQIATQPYAEAHFATFPEALVEPCVLAGTSEGGACSKCGTPWTHRVAVGGGTIGRDWNAHGRGTADLRIGHTKVQKAMGEPFYQEYRRFDLGYEPGCACGDPPIPSIVLDPFAGSGTALLVAQRLGRSAVGVEVNPRYCELARRRIEPRHSQTRLVFR